MGAERCLEGHPTLQNTFCMLPWAHPGYHGDAAGRQWAPLGMKRDGSVPAPARQEWRFTGRHCHNAATGRPCSYLVWTRVGADGEPLPRAGSIYGRDWVMKPDWALAPSLPLRFSA